MFNNANDYLHIQFHFLTINDYNHGKQKNKN